MSQEMSATISAVVSVAGLLVSIFTLYVIIVYTRETGKMRRAAAAQSRELTHQIRLSIMPAFTVAFVKREDVKDWSLPPKEAWYYLELHNVGNGVATGIQIAPLAVQHDPDMSLENFPKGEIFFRWVSSLKPSASERLDWVASTKDQGGRTADLMRWMQTYGAAGKIYPLMLRFRDIEGNEYTQTLNLTRGDCAPSPVRAVAAVTDEE